MNNHNNNNYVSLDNTSAPNQYVSNGSVPPSPPSAPFQQQQQQPFHNGQMMLQQQQQQASTNSVVTMSGMQISITTTPSYMSVNLQAPRFRSSAKIEIATSMDSTSMGVRSILFQCLRELLDGGYIAGPPMSPPAMGMVNSMCMFDPSPSPLPPSTMPFAGGLGMGWYPSPSPQAMYQGFVPANYSQQQQQAQAQQEQYNLQQSQFYQQQQLSSQDPQFFSAPKTAQKVAAPFSTSESQQQQHPTVITLKQQQQVLNGNQNNSQTQASANSAGVSAAVPKSIIDFSEYRGEEEHVDDEDDEDYSDDEDEDNDDGEAPIPEIISSENLCFSCGTYGHSNVNCYKYKRQLCKFKEFCTRGDKCWFAHSVGEIRKPQVRCVKVFRVSDKLASREGCGKKHFYKSCPHGFRPKTVKTESNKNSGSSTPMSKKGGATTNATSSSSASHSGSQKQQARGPPRYPCKHCQEEGHWNDECEFIASNRAKKGIDIGQWASSSEIVSTNTEAEDPVASAPAEASSQGDKN